LPPDLRYATFDFASRINDLLNRTVTNGRVTSVIQEDGKIGWIGYGIKRGSPFPGEPLPLTVTAAPAKCFLHVMHTVFFDEENLLTAKKTTYGVYAGPTLDDPVLFHYDYYRDADNPYPNAHFQVPGHSDALEMLNQATGQSKELGHLHFPVGGKRFRPTLEDLIDFLIVEGYIEARAGWQDVVREHRDWYQRIQLRAAVRGDPDTSREELSRLGLLEPPPPDSN
jgi:hypothetical protein